MKQLTCQRCSHTWTYKGDSDWFTSCPRCKTSVNTKQPPQAKERK